MVKEDLPDLPGSMVVHTVKSSAPDAGDVALHAARSERTLRRGEAHRHERRDEHDRQLRGHRPARRGRSVRSARRCAPRGRSGATCRRFASATSSSFSATTASSSDSRKSSTDARRRPSAKSRLRSRLGRVERRRLCPPELIAGGSEPSQGSELSRSRRCKEGSGKAGRRPGRSPRRRRRARRSRRSPAARPPVTRGSSAWPAARRCERLRDHAPAAGRSGTCSVRPVSTMSSTSSTRRPAIGAARSLVISTTPDDTVASP